MSICSTSTAAFMVSAPPKHSRLLEGRRQAGRDAQVVGVAVALVSRA